MDIKENAGNVKNAINLQQSSYDDNQCEKITVKTKEKNIVRTYKKCLDIKKNASPLNEENYNLFECVSCKFVCKKQSNYEKHLQTSKHIKNTNDVKDNIDNIFKCVCDKVFKTNSGFYKHKRTCIFLKSNINNNNKHNDNNIIQLKENNINNSKENSNEIIEKNMTLLTNLIVEVVKNNNEFQKQIFDLVKASSITNNNINMNNCNNQTFNLQLFLNETCKDAMNMSEFINSFNLQMDDLERLADDGYVKTMSNLIINKVRELDVEKRPIHCSDEKRETIYIKEDNVWIKDDENKSHLRKAVNKIGTKNIGVLQDWQQAHPNCIKANSPYNDTYLKMMREVMGGKDSTGNENKVMKNIIKEVVIDKQYYLK